LLRSYFKKQKVKKRLIYTKNALKKPIWIPIKQDKKIKSIIIYYEDRGWQILFILAVYKDG